jgi:hypothetical protein
MILTSVTKGYAKRSKFLDAVVDRYASTSRVRRDRWAPHFGFARSAAWNAGCSGASSGALEGVT